MIVLHRIMVFMMLMMVFRITGEDDSGCLYTCSSL